ncbi:MAG: hypothetical protein AAB316_02320 [Bacteroidota bacterium]
MEKGKVRMECAALDGGVRKRTGEKLTGGKFLKEIFHLSPDSNRD